MFVIEALMYLIFLFVIPTKAVTHKCKQVLYRVIICPYVFY